MQQLDNKQERYRRGTPARREGGRPDAPGGPERNNRIASEVSDLFARIDRLAELCELGLLTEAEFEANKRDLLRLN